MPFGSKGGNTLKVVLTHISPKKKPQYILNIPAVLSGKQRITGYYWCFQGCLLWSKLVAKSPLRSLLSKTSSEVSPAPKSWEYKQVLCPGCITVLNRVVFPRRPGPPLPRSIDPKVGGLGSLQSPGERKAPSELPSLTHLPPISFLKCRLWPYPLQGNELLLSCLFMRILSIRFKDL